MKACLRSITSDEKPNQAKIRLKADVCTSFPAVETGKQRVQEAPSESKDWLRSELWPGPEVSELFTSHQGATKEVARHDPGSHRVRSRLRGAALGS